MDTQPIGKTCIGECKSLDQDGSKDLTLRCGQALAGGHYRQDETQGLNGLLVEQTHLAHRQAHDNNVYVRNGPLVNRKALAKVHSGPHAIWQGTFRWQQLKRWDCSLPASKRLPANFQAGNI